ALGLGGRPAPRGHEGVALAGRFAGRRVLAFLGRRHLYQGWDAREVAAPVALAVNAGATTVVLTNAAGGLDPQMRAGDLMLIRDHLNLTGHSPLDGSRDDPFLDLHDAYAPRLRALARSLDPALREGIYAGVRGPQYETPAEAALLRVLGADAVGMSTVLETLAARARGCEVLGISLIGNLLDPVTVVSHADVLAAGAHGAVRLGDLLEAVSAAV
ncbi:MAG: purine-nucleoside phosphorylase, partial [Candidatus Dormibacteria bacterium]